MELPLLRFSSDQSQTTLLSYLNPQNYTTKKTNLLTSYGFSFNSIKLRTPLSLIRCSTGLQPRPKPEPKPKTNQLLKELQPHSAKPQIKRSAVPSLCREIEKLVRFRRYEDALELFEVVESEGDFDVGGSTYDALVKACIELRSVRGVKKVYGYMVRSGFERDQYMDNRVLLMHVKCGMMIDARRLFDEMPRRNVVSWNTIVVGLVDSGDYEVAFDLFIMMWREFSDVGCHNFVTMIRAAAGLGSGYVGRQLHSNALKIGIDDHTFVSCGLINMYSKCGNVEDALRVFEEMPEKTVVGWNSIMAGYALHGYSEEALSMCCEMQASGVQMDHFTYSMIISICARLASVEYAKQAHAGLLRNGYDSNLEANSALVDFYGKWGKVQHARYVFDRMPRKNLTSWNAMIAGYSNHGKGIEAVVMFEQMVREGLVPNHVTLLAVLSGCAHSGLSDKGWEIFESMERKYRIIPRAMHYACMIQLLGREGLLDEAMAFIRDAPFTPTENMWAALLNACRVHKNFELAKYAAEKLYAMEPEKLSNYVVLLNIYNSSGRLKEADEVVQTLRRRGLRMRPACSWIEVKKQTHFFHSGDRSHVQTEEIYRKLDDVMQEIAKHGDVTVESLLPDVDKQEEEISFYHSEKLAIAFGLISTSALSSLQIVQSHRVCSNCHDVIKLIALITQREILVKDASRFHHFKDGVCSCGDYW